MELSNALLEHYLELTAAREKIISSNMANIDTGLPHARHQLRERAEQRHERSLVS
jgi:flagellar basal body rod protein FlgB